MVVAGPVSDALDVQFWGLLTGITITAVSVTALFVPAIVQIEKRARPAMA